MSDFLPGLGLGPNRGTESPPAGTYGSHDDWADVDRDVERAFLGAVMLRPCSDRTPSPVRVEASHMSSALRADMLTTLRSLWPWTDSTEMERALVAALSRRFGHKQAQLEVADCLCNGVLWGQVGPVAQDVVNGWKRRERVRIARRIMESAHDGETVAALLDEMARLWSKPEDHATVPHEEPS